MFCTSHRLLVVVAAMVAASALARGEERPRARELGLEPGVLGPGPLNAITDVEGVRVGHATTRRGESVRTGVTAIVRGRLSMTRRPEDSGPCVRWCSAKQPPAG